ncbi:MAG: hypothetical protein L0H88_04595, partial [Propionibacterium sp.]|nr:hypothetical protein [Propionibacterium sp.]
AAALDEATELSPFQRDLRSYGLLTARLTIVLVVVVLALAGQFRGKDQWAVNVAKAPAVGPSPFQP